jgi:alpha-galactosidase
MTVPTDPPIHLRAAGTSLVLDVAGDRMPAVVHWGADLGDLAPADLAER